MWEIEESKGKVLRDTRIFHIIKGSVQMSFEF